MSRRIVGIALRISLAAAFLSAVADRFGWWALFGQGSWGSMGAFADYTHQLVPVATGSLLTVIAWASTATETLLGVLLLIGWRPALVGWGTCLVLTIFGTAMAISLGLASPLSYSVFSAASAAAAYAIIGSPSPSRLKRSRIASHSDTTDPEYDRSHRWRDATRELVLVGATAVAAADQPQTAGSIAINVTGAALSNDLLLADTGFIPLASVAGRQDARRIRMTVVPMRLDMLSDQPSVAVLAQGVAESTQLRLMVELTARNPQTGATSVIACEYRSVHLDAQTPRALMDFQPQRAEIE